MNKQATHQKPIRISSLNARERVQYVSKINSENKKMHARLKGVTAMISAGKQEEDFQRHQKMREHLRRPIFGASPHHKTKRKDGNLSFATHTSSVGTLPAIGARNPLDEIRDEVIGKKKRAEIMERQQSISKINPNHKVQNHTISFTHEPESPQGKRYTATTTATTTTNNNISINVQLHFAAMEQRARRASDQLQNRIIGALVERWKHNSMSEWHKRHIRNSAEPRLR